MKLALERIDKDDTTWPEVQFNAARIAVALGHDNKAREHLEALRNDRRRSDLIDRQSRELLLRIEARLDGGSGY